MVLIVAIVAAAFALGLWVYVLREDLGAEGVGLATLRAAGVGLLALLLLNPSWLDDAVPGRTTVLLDRSLSFHAAGGQWETARDTARRIAGPRGRLLGFGATVGPVEDSVPLDGDSRLREALTVARGLGGPVTVVTDGELTDLATIPPQLLNGVEMVVLPRHDVPGVALLHVDLPTTVARDDSVVATVVIGTWGQLGGRVSLEVTLDGRRLRGGQFDLPPPPATARRAVVLPPRALAPGTHVVAFRVAADGDVELRDNVRLRTITVTDVAPIVVILDPPDWDGRFLAAVVADVSGVPVRGFARVAGESWIETRKGTGVTATTIRQAVTGASLVVARGDLTAWGVPGTTPVWRWSVEGEAPQLGEWYLSGPVPSSPLLADLARVEWDSLPPLLAANARRGTADSWTVLAAREGRRGPPRPLVVGSTSGSRRELVTGGDGFYRWMLRGGAGLEAFRTLVAAGTDWLLASDRPARRGRLDALRVVQRGVPVGFQWRADSPPDSVAVTLQSATADTVVVLRFDVEGRASASLDPGTYQWQWDGERGSIVVEEYSDEWPPRDGVVRSERPADGVTSRVEAYLRQRWWAFALVIVAFVGEWAWRQRRGLP
ncbi:MAG: hypothetical protein OEO20_05970 [Gemmatimonadota bacterium]|nr:hypothetical protein [Gemmatimonadota bacterium]MDH3368313.1 hypothetical protein [Gemmatimonadota bacterium]MDH3477833.1 hypothetical protein [Gemmatimonadota bacterium]MDH3570010.1 hypothetical protein [Gemmatimonadota bacterium]MDH5549962.1 hypothetical protein [Gemmatimonadota bacterium]